MAGDSEDDEFNRFSQEVVRLSQGSNEDKSAADAAGDEGSQERERGNTNGDGQEHSPTTVIPDTCPPMSQVRNTARPVFVPRKGPAVRNPSNLSSGHKKRTRRRGDRATRV